MTASQNHGVIGADFDRPTTQAEFAPGSLTWGDEDAAWLYCRADAGGVSGAGYVVLIDEDFAADMLDTTNSAAGFGQRVGVAAAAVAASQYFWAQVRGVAAIRVAASAAANAALNATATAGQADDDATAGAEIIDGLVLTTANGGAAGTAVGVLDDPRVGATIA